MTQLTALILGDGPREYTITFNASKQASKEEHYQAMGARLVILQNATLQSVPESRLSLERRKSEVFSVNKPKAIQVKALPQTHASTVVIPKRAVGRLKSAKPKPEKVVKAKPEKEAKPEKPAAKSGPGRYPKAVINITNNTYHTSVSEAAHDCDGSLFAVSRVLNKRTNHTQHRGCEFRFATKAEAKAKRVLTT